MGLKMGSNNPITAERWHEIKREWRKTKEIASNDEKIAERCGVGKTTAGLVRRTNSYYEYRLRTDKSLKNIRKHPIVVVNRFGMAYEDYFYRPIKKKRDQKLMLITAEKDREAERTALACGIWMVGAVVVVLLGIAITVALLIAKGMGVL